MTALEDLFEILDASEDDDLNLSEIMAQSTGPIIIEDCCCCCC